MLFLSLIACDVHQSLTAVEDAFTAGYAAVDDVDFTEVASGRIERGAIALDWSFQSRDLGWTTFDMERGIPASLRRIEALAKDKGWDTSSCEAVALEVYELESRIANQAGRFELEERPGPDEVLAGVYDPRPFVAGEVAIVLTPTQAVAQRRTLLAHELAHLAHDVCGWPGDSEDFAEEAERMVLERPGIARDDGPRARKGKRPDGERPERPGASTDDDAPRTAKGPGRTRGEGPPRKARRSE